MRRPLQVARHSFSLVIIFYSSLKSSQIPPSATFKNSLVASTNGTCVFAFTVTVKLFTISTRPAFIWVIANR